MRRHSSSLSRDKPASMSISPRLPAVWAGPCGWNELWIATALLLVLRREIGTLRRRGRCSAGRRLILLQEPVDLARVHADGVARHFAARRAAVEGHFEPAHVDA